MTELNVESKEYLNTVSIELASQCNLKCRMCSHPANTRGTELMSVSNFKKIIDKIAEQTPIRNLFFNMGEPFMNKSIIMMIAHAKRNGFSVFLSTNGLLLNENVMHNLFKTGVDALKFSIEGTTPEVYDSIRIGGNFDRLFRNVVRLKELRDRSGSSLRIRISTILLKGNEDIVEFVKFWGPYCDEIEYTTVTNHIGLKDNHDIALASDWNQRRGCPQILPYREVNILSSGDMVLCCVDFHGRCVFGNLIEQDFDEIWNSVSMREVREKAYNDQTHDLDPCRECYIADYSPVFWKDMRQEVNVVHEGVKNRMWQVVNQIHYIPDGNKTCGICSEPIKISFAGACLRCLEKKSGQG